MDKYYEPNLEEFYQGFEYESQQMDGDGYYTNEYCEFEYEIGEKIDLNKVRIKYLDKEDIESLGWEWKKDKASYPTMFLGYWMLKPDGDMYELKSNSYLHYYGPIKNKSELKKLMKQLEIG